MHACGRCRGVWLNNAACQALVQQKLSHQAEQCLRESNSAERGAKREQHVYRDAAPNSSVDCPACGTGLVHYMTTRRDHGIQITLDVCQAHGTWFDAGEAWSLVQSLKLEKMADAFSTVMRRLDVAWSSQLY